MPEGPIHDRSRDEANELLAEVAIMLVDAGVPLAADEAVWRLGILQPADVLPALSRSLRWGAAGITPDSDG